MNRARMYSTFWSNREYLAIQGLRSDYQAIYFARRKALKAINAMKDIVNEEVVTEGMLIDTLEGARKFARLLGLDETAEKIDGILKELRVKISERIELMEGESNERKRG